MRYAHHAWVPVVLAAAVVASFVLPHVVADYRLYEFARVGLFFVAIFGLNILTGYNGQISLGHGAFMAVGGYTSAILMVHYGWTDWQTIPVAALVAGVAGFLFGIPALRLSGLYLALATFSLAVALPSIIKKWESETGGSTGLILTSFHTNLWYFRLCWICAGITFVLGWLLLQTRFSRAWRAIRDSEIAAASLGVWGAAYKTAAFGISAAYAGVAGALLVILAGSANPGNFPVQLSIYLVVGLAVGGLGSTVWILLGAIFVEYVPTWAPSLVHSKAAGIPTVAFGVALILVMFLLPGGFAGLVRRLTNLPLVGHRSSGS